MLKFTQFVTLGNISVFKNLAQAFAAGDFLNIFLRIWLVFEAHFLIKNVYSNSVLFSIIKNETL